MFLLQIIVLQYGNNEKGIVNVPRGSRNIKTWHIFLNLRLNL